MSGPHGLKIAEKTGPYRRKEEEAWYYREIDGLHIVIEMWGPDGLYVYTLVEDRRQEAQK